MKLIYYYPKEAYEIYDLNKWEGIKAFFLDENDLRYIFEYPSDDVNATDKELLSMINIANSFLISPNNYKLVLNGNSELISVVFDRLNDPVFIYIVLLYYFYFFCRNLMIQNHHYIYCIIFLKKHTSLHVICSDINNYQQCILIINILY